ncbi:ATP-binding protein [Variovorax sp.]|uniref:ATP-binding protein n=1 Tax=Variovorax sp. TaxID=1871043 RepID=UPI002D7858EB|nr:ATP-binding protein [Variovorax sp.]
MSPAVPAMAATPPPRDADRRRTTPAPAEAGAADDPPGSAFVPAAFARGSGPGPHAIVMSGNLRRDLLRLGLMPCAAAALALTAWFTHARLEALEHSFDAEGQAIARQVAALTDLSLYAGDQAAVQAVANSALRGGQATRVEISNNAGLFVSAGPAVGNLEKLRVYTAPVRLRESPGASPFGPPAPGATAAAPPGPGAAPIGLVQAFRDTTAYSRERYRSLLAGVGIALIALLVAWASVRHMARSVTRPLRRISQTVAALEGGHFDTRCDVEAAPARGAAEAARPHELASLAHDVNRLAERLAHNHQVSEERVREATSVALQRMAEAEQAALSRARFLAAASHDLRQPLHAMGLFIDGLLPGASDAQRPAVLRLQEGTQFMTLLLDDLLEISRLDAQVLTPKMAPVALDTLFEQLAAQHAAQAAQSQVRMVFKPQGRLVHSDAAMLLRIVGNLIGNAIRHAPPEGTVLVAARRGTRPGTTRIEVRDNGIGIAPIHQQRIFEEFYQVANTERDRRQGFGLGLAICARLAALMGSRIELRSALLEGSTFSLTLAQARQAPAPRPSAAPPAGAPLAGLRCLVVDDDDAILHATHELLRQWACVPVCTRTVADAIALMSEPDAQFDVVLCDLQLAGHDDGLAVIDSARKLQPDALAVLVSGATGPESLKRLRAHDASLLTKPVAPAKLRALLTTRRQSATPVPVPFHA